MLHAHATKKHFLQVTSRHRMISTLVENSFPFPFFFPTPQATIPKPKFYYGTHNHLISFVKGTETVYITFSPGEMRYLTRSKAEAHFWMYARFWATSWKNDG